MDPRTRASLRRSWHFIPGASEAAFQTALQTDCDVIVVDLEEMTPPPDRPRARAIMVDRVAAASARGAYLAVRINKLESDGHADLEGIFPARPNAIFLPHAETVEQLTALDAALATHERRHGIFMGSTTIVPTIESALGLVSVGALLRASPRIRACMLAVEDLANSLGARRTPAATELLYARSQFLLECRAAGCLPIDLPCTYRAQAILAADLDLACNLGFEAKCVVFPEHVDLVNRAFTPSSEAVAAAHAVLRSKERQDNVGEAHTVDWIDSPTVNNANRILARHAVCEAASRSSDVEGNPR